jgi:ornithine decarboxylase
MLPSTARSAPVAPDPEFASSAELVAALEPAEPVYCVYPEVLRALARGFLEDFPGRVLYAVKANPERRVLEPLWSAGVRHFDTASLGEMRAVRAVAADAACHFMAPVKFPGAMREAFDAHGVRDCAIDHADELERVAREVPARELTIFVRMAAHDPAAVYDLSQKFGASEERAVELLRAVERRGAKPALAFNVGSLVRCPDAYANAIERAAALLRRSGVEVAWLDLGGGFPRRYPEPAAEPIERFFAAIAEARSALPATVGLLAEPGRALVADGITLVTRVLHRDGDRLYLNDGVWGSLVEPLVAQGRFRFPTRVLRGGVQVREDALEPFTVFGPTCDSLDRLPRPLPFPKSIAAGDFVEFGMIGAYSLANRTAFNGIYPDRFARIRARSLPEEFAGDYGASQKGGSQPSLPE